MLSFVYITCRNNPRLEWFIDSLYNQANDIGFDLSKIQIVIVDYELQYQDSRKEYVSNIIKNRFEYIHVPPKPSPYQGPYKLTKVNYHTCSTPRNTGICYTKYDYIAFIDDLSVMEPNSFKEIVECARRNIVVAFAYKKVYELCVENGNIVHKREHAGGIDSRWNQGSEFRKIGGSQLFGYSASPLEVILNVNGYDEICTSMGGEDYQYGIRVEKTGVEIFYNRNVVFNESEEFADQGNVFIRRDPLLGNDEYYELMKKYGVTHRMVPNGRTDLSHFILDLLTRNKYLAEGNSYNLRELRNLGKNNMLSFETKFDTNMKSLEGVLLRDM
jgi:hypothetical protein